MRSMGIDRRHLLLGALAGYAVRPVCALAAPGEGGEGGKNGTLYLNAYGDGAGGFGLAALADDGAVAWDLPLPSRGHAATIRPHTGEIVQFARRPGRFAIIVAAATGGQLDNISNAPGRCFNGHGVFSADGRILYATENDYAGERGVIGVYAADNAYRRIGELQAHGIGPHEIVRLSERPVLAVANGGILTHPDLPRLKLNLPSMRPALVYLDMRDGALLQEVKLPPALHQLSIRHLAVGRGDVVAIAMQYEGPEGDPVPLVAIHRPGAPDLQLLALPEKLRRRMKQYCGSVCFDRAGRIFAVSAPRGNLVTFWDVERGVFLRAITLADGCAIAPDIAAGMFLVAGGAGDLVRMHAVSGKTEPLLPRAGAETRHWDNHMLAAGI